ncbi:MAG: hypothetical protein KIT39_14365 [Nitrospirales bacterium]|nr:hypothetical protein [Nitrospirales bacterium]
MKPRRATTVGAAQHWRPAGGVITPGLVTGTPHHGSRTEKVHTVNRHSKEPSGVIHPAHATHIIACPALGVFDANKFIGLKVITKICGTGPDIHS